MKGYRTETGMTAYQGCRTQLLEGWVAPTLHAMGTRLSTEDKMHKVILDCMWELQPHNSSSGQAPQHYTYNLEIGVLSQSSSWQRRVNVLHWEGLSPGFTSGRR